MSWLDMAYVAIFICNGLFMVGALTLLLKILRNIENTRFELSRSSRESTEASQELGRIARHLQNGLERLPNDLSASDASASRAIGEMADRVSRLSEFIDRAFRNLPPAKALASPDELADRLRDKLKDVMTQNMRLKSELDVARAKLLSAVDNGDRLGKSLHESGASPLVVKELNRLCTELKLDLEEAHRRTRAAEKVAEENKLKLEELRDELAQQAQEHSEAASKTVPKLQALVEDLEARERNLMDRLQSLESEFARSLTEKQFIEDRYVLLDSSAS